MIVTHLKSESRSAWNALAAQEERFALLQSWEWGDFKEKLGWRVIRIGLIKADRLVAGAQLLINPLPGGFLSAAYLPRGPIGSWRERGTASRLFRELHEVARAHHAAFLKVEPSVLHDPSFEAFMTESGFRISPFSIQPRATIVLDLNPDLETLLKGMRQKTRQNIRGAQRDGITIERGGAKDVAVLSEISRQIGRREGIPYRRRDYFLHEWQTFGTKDMMALLLAKRQGQLLAVRTVFRFGAHAAEFHGAAFPAGWGSRANFLLVWEAIQWAKAHGCTTYDFWGIPDEAGRMSLDESKDADGTGRTDGLWGVYQFKKGFSRVVQYYSASYDYAYSRLLYRLLSRRGDDSDLLERLASWADRFKRRPWTVGAPSGPCDESPENGKDSPG